METAIPNRLMTIQEAAQFLAVSVSTLYGWVWQRRISFVKVGRALRFKRHDLENFIQTNRVEARPEMKTGQPSRELRRIRDAAGKG
jgi:excisionase family DNA binding protein